MHSRFSSTKYSQSHFWLNPRQRAGFSLVELAVVIVIILTFVALSLPAVRTAKGAARRMKCGNNVKQLALALMEYEDHHRGLPALWGGPAQLVDRSEQPRYIAHEDAERNLPPVGRWSAFIAILPYFESATRYDSIQGAFTDKTGTIQPPIAPWNTVQGRYTPWLDFQSALVTCSEIDVPHGRANASSSQEVILGKGVT